MRSRIILSLVLALVLTGVPGVDAVSAVAGDSATQQLINSYRHFDRPVNPDQYLLRPGDVLGVTFINANLSRLQLAVDPEGNIINSTLAIYGVAGQTLTQVRPLLNEQLKILYNADEPAISIGNPMKVAVAVSGAVRRPGLYTAWSSQRVSEIVDSAGGVISMGSRRRIVLSGGPVEIDVDLDRARFLGDVEANPCLYGGYQVFVPGKSNDRVQVVGELNFPREIELKPGDDLDLLLALAGGVRSSGDSSSVQVIRNANTLEASGLQLKPGDIIVVPPREDEIGSDDLIIFGAVVQPGRYGFRSNMTLPDLIEAAGGFSDEAARTNSVLFRKARTDERGRKTTLRYPISCSSKDRTELSDITLLPSDSIFVPTAIGYVRIRGAIRNPGYYMYVAGEDALYYVAHAGGFLPSANRDLIGVLNRISSVTGTHPPQIMIQDGDEIVVEIREELK